ncbi:methyltransferase domain-containing protein [Maribellus comscasis]|uniref:Methyltransferase domain-containing protein n=1 Tax=Maribellus comscasis TaxID=2681766 RepID=A0A6I6K0X5_9BACT|nr:class I SAM-dependent methyltransferase [Maribellus comscasis]QGY47078.1 methyltransferase domain-containing protein [Maribellus comscasis]
MNDPFGLAINDFYRKGKAPDIKVDSNYTKDERISVSHFFRDENEMPEIEKAALKKCKGKVLDVGAAAGCHSLALQKKGFNITALDKSELSVEVMKKRGIQKFICSDIFEYSGNTFDTVLLLMNGTGIGGTLEGLKKLFRHLKTLLSENGQILIDSSDIKYLFEEDDGSLWIDLASDKYYGEMKYKVKYKNETDEFNWLFIDYDLLNKTALDTGLKCELAASGNHFDYLARISLK